MRKNIMPLSDDQVAVLLRLVASVRPDEMDCDGCFEHLAQFADVELRCQDLPGALQAVQNHLEQCPCCQDEYEVLMQGLHSMEEN